MSHVSPETRHSNTGVKLTWASLALAKGLVVLLVTSWNKGFLLISRTSSEVQSSVGVASSHPWSSSLLEEEGQDAEEALMNSSSRLLFSCLRTLLHRSLQLHLQRNRRTWVSVGAGPSPLPLKWSDLRREL